jgi:cytochrome c biogenesis protein ResB
VEVSRSGAVLVPAFQIRVNHPLRLGSLSIYQASFGPERVLELEGPAGERRSLAAGERIDAPGGSIMLMSLDLDSGKALARVEGSSGPRTLSLGPGSKLGAFTVEKAEEVELSGLRASFAPEYPVVILGFALSALGISITLARKLREPAA